MVEGVPMYREKVCILVKINRRVVRVVEGARLESVYRRNPIEGSNPSLSAKYIYKQLLFSKL